MLQTRDAAAKTRRPTPIPILKTIASLCQIDVDSCVAMVYNISMEVARMSCYALFAMVAIVLIFGKGEKCRRVGE